MPRDSRADKFARRRAPTPNETVGTSRSATGTIKFWRGRKGFGAVASDATAPWDIWCHFTVIEVTGALPRDHQRGGWTHYVGDPLKAGERVEVEYSREDHGTFKYVARLLRRLPGPTRAA